MEQEVLAQAQLFLGADGTSRACANRYLQEFQSRPEAWEIFQRLITPQTPQGPMLLMTQLMYNKLRTEWNALTDQLKLQLRQFAIGLLTANLGCRPAYKKICQCVSFIGVYTFKDLWPTFISDITTGIESVEMVIDIVDSIAYVLEDVSVERPVREHVKSLLKAEFGLILNYFATIFTVPTYLEQIAECMSGWKALRLSVLGHTSIPTTLIGYLAAPESIGDALGYILDILTDSLETSESADLLQLGIRVTNTQDAVFAQIPAAEMQNLDALLLALFQHGPALLQNQTFAKQTATLVSTFCQQFTILMLYNDERSATCWSLVEQILRHQSLSISFIICDFLYSFKDQALMYVQDFGQRLWLFDRVLTAAMIVIERCRYESVEQWLALTQITDNFNLKLYRQNAEEILNGVYQIYEKYHPETEICFLQALSPLVASSDAENWANQEVYLLVIKSIMFSIIAPSVRADKKAEFLSQILTKIFALPRHPLVVKAAIFVFIDGATAFWQDTTLSEMFPAVVEYVITNALGEATCFLNSNAVECIFQFSMEPDARYLFNQQLISNILSVTERYYETLGAELGIKLLRANFNLIALLSAEAYVELMGKTLAPLLLPAASVEQFTTIVMALDGALTPVDDEDAPFEAAVLTGVFQTALDTIIPQANAIISQRQGTQKLTDAIVSLYRRMIRVFSTHFDSYFVLIAQAIVTGYTSAMDSYLQIIDQGLGTLVFEPQTSAWIVSGFLEFSSTLAAEIGASAIPTTITYFYKIQKKLLETELADQVAQPALMLALQCMPALTEREAARSVQDWLLLALDLYPNFCGHVTSGLLSHLDRIHSSTYTMFSSQLLVKSQAINPAEFASVVEQTITTAERYQQFTADQKTRLITCLVYAGESMLKGFTHDLADILKGNKTCAALATTEIAIASRGKPPIVVDLT